MGNFKASVCLAFGYLLLYAGISNGGVYATRPWAALTQ